MNQHLHFAVPTPDLIAQLGRVAAQTFNFPIGQFTCFCNRVGAENLRVALQGNRVVGGMAAYQFGQWFGGRCLPMAGIALVCVSPEARATGVSQFMLVETLREHRQRQVPLATLFASTQRPYRKVGFEQAGDSRLWDLPIAQIGRHEQSLPVHRLDTLAANHFEAVAEQRARITNGNLQRTEGAWARLFDTRGNPTRMYGYVVGRSDAPEGYLIYKQISQSRTDQVLLVRDMAAMTVEAAYSLWALIYDHRSIFSRVRWYGAQHDIFGLTSTEFQPEIAHWEHWMTRIIDVQLALGLRGYPRGLNLQLDLEVHDDMLPENEGRYRLTLAGGTGTVERGGDGDLQMDIRGLSPLFSGFCDAALLRTAGLVSGSDATIETANLTFSGPESWMPDKF